MDAEQEEETVSLTGGETDNGVDENQTLTDVAPGLNDSNENTEENAMDASGSSETFDPPPELLSNPDEEEKNEQSDGPETETIQDAEPENTSEPATETPTTNPTKSIEDISTVAESSDLPASESITELPEENPADTANPFTGSSFVEVPSAPVTIPNIVTESRLPKLAKEIEGGDRMLAEVSDCPNLGLVDKVLITDVTTEKGTVTVKECTTDEGFFALLLPEAKLLSDKVKPLT